MGGLEGVVPHTPHLRLLLQLLNPAKAGFGSESITPGGADRASTKVGRLLITRVSS